MLFSWKVQIRASLELQKHSQLRPNEANMNTTNRTETKPTISKKEVIARLEELVAMGKELNARLDA